MKWSPFKTFVLLVLFSLSAATSLGNEGREQQQLLDLLAQREEQLRVLQNSTWTQLLNHDLVSAPQLVQRTNSLLEEIEFLRSEFRERYPEASLPEPSIVPASLAARLDPIRREVIHRVGQRLSRSSPFNIEFRSITPAPAGQGARVGYPHSSFPGNQNDFCTTGGFISRSQNPSLEGFESNQSLHNDFSRWTDRICTTPQRLRLQLNGQTVHFQCSPDATETSSVGNALSAMEMCDPMLYGFFPRDVADGTRLLALCRFPSQLIIGRSPNYDSELAGPDTSNPSGYASHCDMMARSQLPHFFQPPEGVTESDVSLILAARLALENPQTFAQNSQRMRSQCDQLTERANRAGHCQNLLHRLSEVERVMQVLTQQPATHEINEAGAQQ